MTQRFGHWINGDWRDPSGGTWLASTQPGTDAVVCEIAEGNAADIDAAAVAASAAAASWRDLKPIERGRRLMALSRALRERVDELGDLENREAGKAALMGPIEVHGSADYFEFYAGLVNLEAGEVLDLGPGFHSYTRREPFGVVGIITPWNAPLNQAARAAAPALAAGNTVVLKPSEITSASSLRLAELTAGAGIPDGVFNVVTGTGPAVGQPLVEHRSVCKVAFTGSLRAGREVGRIAGERIIPVTLELGGKSANIVFADADIGAAVQGSLRAFVLNTGQICSSGTRLLVQADIHDAFVEALVDASSQYAPFLGQLTTEAQFDKVNHYFEIAASEGAVAATGGRMADGWQPEITVYTNANNNLRIAREEIFGPVVAVIPFDDEESAIAIANDSDFGLAAGLWTRDISRAHRVASRLEAGQVFVNMWGTGIETPFGGYKQSGIGREKGIEALHHYTQVKSVTISL